MIKSTDIEMTTASSTTILVYFFVSAMLVGTALLALHVYVIPAIVHGYKRTSYALYNFLGRHMHKDM
jgi:hypothetical protein